MKRGVRVAKVLTGEVVWKGSYINVKMKGCKSI